MTELNKNENVHEVRADDCQRVFPSWSTGLLEKVKIVSRSIEDRIRNVLDRTDNQKPLMGQ